MDAVCLAVQERLGKVGEHEAVICAAGASTGSAEVSPVAVRYGVADLLQEAPGLQEQKDMNLFRRRGRVVARPSLDSRPIGSLMPAEYRGIAVEGRKPAERGDYHRRREATRPGSAGRG